ncbi:hypothetical protein SNK05_000079 [Fusarium graminearum]|nr:hypothetical protein HG531_002857 [Fusarium graminearum]
MLIASFSSITSPFPDADILSSTNASTLGTAGTGMSGGKFWAIFHFDATWSRKLLIWSFLSTSTRNGTTRLSARTPNRTSCEFEYSLMTIANAA